MTQPGRPFPKDGVVGPQGPAGSVGADGATGPAGPNVVSTATVTTMTGLMKGDGAHVAIATAGSDYVDPSSLGTAAARNVGTAVGEVPAFSDDGMGDTILSVPGLVTNGITSLNSGQTSNIQVINGISVSSLHITFGDGSYSAPNGVFALYWDAGGSYGPSPCWILVDQFVYGDVIALGSLNPDNPCGHYSVLPETTADFTSLDIVADPEVPGQYDIANIIANPDVYPAETSFTFPASVSWSVDNTGNLHCRSISCSVVPTLPGLNLEGGLVYLNGPAPVQPYAGESGNLYAYQTVSGKYGRVFLYFDAWSSPNGRYLGSGTKFSVSFKTGTNPTLLAACNVGGSGMNGIVIQPVSTQTGWVIFEGFEL